MNNLWERWLPVIISILIILTVAFLRNYSKSVAAIAAVMPINIPLGMWIVYSGSDDKQAALSDFSSAMLVNIIPTLAFMIVAWQMTKAGHGLFETIALGYLVWGVGLGAIFLLRYWLTA